MLLTTHMALLGALTHVTTSAHGAHTNGTQEHTAQKQPNGTNVPQERPITSTTAPVSKLSYQYDYRSNRATAAGYLTVTDAVTVTVGGGGSGGGAFNR